ncbi:MAG: sigma 54-interacting transcriptional regulator [Pseudomonadota bacterium]
MKAKASDHEPPDEFATRILFAASLFKIEFSIDWLLELTGEKAADTLKALDFGLRRGVLRSRRAGWYEFGDQKDREGCLERGRGAPETLLGRAAAILLRELPESPDRSGAVAELLLRLTNDLDGCRLLIAAADSLRKAYRTAAAFECYTKALEDLQPLRGRMEADHLFIDAAIQYSKLSSATSDSTLVIAALKKASALAAEHGLTAQLALLRMHLAKQEWLRSRYGIALRRFNQGWADSRHIDNETFQRSARIFSMFFHYWLGRFKDAVDSYEQFLPEIENIPKAHFPLQARLTIGSCYAHCGQVSLGVGMLDAIREHCNKSGDVGLAGHALVAIAVIFFETGRVEEIDDLLDEALSQGIAGQNIFIRIGALLCKAYGAYLLGRPDEAVANLVEFGRLSQAAQMELRNYPQVLDMCWAMEQGRLPMVPGYSFQEEVARAVGSRNVFMKGMGYRYLALDHRRRGWPAAEVSAALAKSLRFLEESGHRIQLASVRLDYARELFNAGLEEKAAALAGPSAQYLMSVNERLVPDDLRHLVKEMRSEKDLLREILALGQELVTLRAHRDVVGRVISTANRLTGAERGAIFILDETTGRLALKAAKNLTREEVESDDFSRSRELIETTFRAAEGRLSEGPPEPPSPGRAIRSRICAPMLLRQDVVGVLYLDNRLYRGAFTASDLELLDYFAALASIALENARAFNVLREGYLKQKEEKQYYEQKYLERMHYEEMVGQSRRIRQVFRQIDSVARTDATVLIHGETGVGKELVARAIHRLSDRKEGPFIHVNCSALSEHLIASELFGHEKGAFTGATQRRLGRFELADGGALFLDEVGDIPLAVQVRLLLVLQSKEFERVGGQATLRSDFRLMAATNRDMLEEVRAGRFRQDLYYRLNVFPILAPPLRERPEDIPLLAHHFLAMFAKRQNKNITRIPPEELDRLTSYHWPGNVRELENLIERGVILSKGPDFRIPEMGLGGAASPDDGAPLTHAENERAHLVRTLKRVRGKISGPRGAAELLDLHPNTLRYRLRKLGITSRDWNN